MAECEEVLDEILTKVAREQGFVDCLITTIQMSSRGSNFTGYLYHASITSSTKAELKLFVKVAASDIPLRSVIPLNFFKIENFVYNELLKTYREIEERHNVPKEHRLLFPKCYGTSDQFLREAIVLEDLTASGYINYDRLIPIDWLYASTRVQNLAKFHALSMVWSVEDPERFKSTDTISVPDNPDDLVAYLRIVVEVAIDATRVENKERFANFIMGVVLDKKYIMESFGPIRWPVIAHCDYKPSNAMYRVNEKGTVDLMTVDYQSLQRGNPVLDLINFILTGSDKSFRDRHYQQILECYYTELSGALRRFGIQPDGIYSRKDFYYEINKVMPVGITTSIFFLLLATADKNEAGEPSHITDFRKIKPSAMFKQRLNEIVDDFIAKGVI